MEKKLTMQEVLAEFKKIWEEIIATGEYNSDVEKMAMDLVAFKKLDLRSQEDLQFFQFATIFTKYILNSRPDKNVKKVLEKISDASLSGK